MGWSVSTREGRARVFGTLLLWMGGLLLAGAVAVGIVGGVALAAGPFLGVVGGVVFCAVASVPGMFAVAFGLDARDHAARLRGEPVDRRTFGQRLVSALPRSR